MFVKYCNTVAYLRFTCNTFGATLTDALSDVLGRGEVGDISITHAELLRQVNVHTKLMSPKSTPTELLT